MLQPLKVGVSVWKAIVTVEAAPMRQHPHYLIPCCVSSRLYQEKVQQLEQKIQLVNEGEYSHTAVLSDVLTILTLYFRYRL